MNDDHGNAPEDTDEDPFVELFMQFGDRIDAQNDKIDRLIELVDDMRIEMHRQREAQALTADLQRQLLSAIMGDQLNSAVTVLLMKRLSGAIDDKLIAEVASKSMERMRGMGWINLVLKFEQQARDLEAERLRRAAEFEAGQQRLAERNELIRQNQERVAREIVEAREKGETYDWLRNRRKEDDRER